MDYIEVYDEKLGRNIKMELVLTYSNNGQDYVIYKDKNNKNYISRFNYENDDLDNNLSKEEIEFGKSLLEGVIQ